MTEITSIAHLHKDFKTLAEWKDFAEKQHFTINFLKSDISLLQDEVNHLKKLLSDAIPIVGDVSVASVIVSPDQALLDDQIRMIQTRAYMTELSLEDVKKLDILLKNKLLINKDSPALDGKPKRPELPSADLLKIAQHGNK